MRMSNRRHTAVVASAAVLPWLAASLFGLSAAAQPRGLVSVQTEKAPVIDGIAEEVWNNAPAFTFPMEKSVYEPSNGYKGMKKTSIMMKSLYDAENIYFLVEWTDPTESLELQPWVKQSDGSWKQLRNPDSTGSENTYFQDKLGLIWNMNGRDFEMRGCSAVCHKARNGSLMGVPEKLPARKYTNSPGELADVWQWEAVTTNPVGQLEDGYIDNNRDLKKNPNWGLSLDHSNGGGTVPNEAGSKPAFMNAAPGGPKYWVLGDAKAPFADTFKAGDTVGSVVVSRSTGSRGDVEAKGLWKAGKWTLEIKRKRATASPKEDVQFTDAKKAYVFGISVFDNSQINHLYTEDVHKLTFK